MISKSKSSETKSALSTKKLIHAIQRNFDGLDEFNATEIFLTHIAHIDSDEQQTSASAENKQTTTPVENKESDTPIENGQIDTNEAEQTASSVENEQTSTLKPLKEKVFSYVEVYVHTYNFRLHVATYLNAIVPVKPFYTILKV